MDFGKQGFKKADELQHGYEFFFGVGEMTPNLHFCLLPLWGMVTLLSTANCSYNPAWQPDCECGRIVIPAQHIIEADNFEQGKLQEDDRL